MKLNEALLAREAAAELGALDPRPEPPSSMAGPTRLMRSVDESGEECWKHFPTGHTVVPSDVQKAELSWGDPIDAVELNRDGVSRET